MKGARGRGDGKEYLKGKKLMRFEAAAETMWEEGGEMIDRGYWGGMGLWGKGVMAGEV